MLVLSFRAKLLFAASSLCYFGYSRTTKKIDLLEIKKHVGVAEAAVILEETLLAAKTLWEHRGEDHQDEPFLFNGEDGNGVRFPRDILGLAWNADIARPDLDIDLGSFYSFGKAFLSGINQLPKQYAYSHDLCPTSDPLDGNISLSNAGIGSNGELECPREGEEQQSFGFRFMVFAELMHGGPLRIIGVHSILEEAQNELVS